MVGGLVEEDQVRVFGERAGERGAAPLAAARRFGGAIEVEADLVGDCVHLMRGGGGGAAHGEIAQRGEVKGLGILLQQHDMRRVLEALRWPSSKSTSPAMRRNSVVLPAPLRPMSAKRSRSPIKD